MSNQPINVLAGSTASETVQKDLLARKLRNSSIPDGEILDNLGLFLTRQTLSRINFMRSIYEKIIPVHGVVMEFGVRWGQNMSLFSSFRGMYEPFNYNRKLIGFDTFKGFPSVAPEDGAAVQAGDYGVTSDWQAELETIMDFHNGNAPLAHKKKHEIVKGDVTETLPDYLAKNPETVVALAYFDLDIYQPTRACLEAILPYITKGTILAFDEINTPEFPGETIALREVLGLSRYAIRREPYNPLTSYIVVE